MQDDSLPSWNDGPNKQAILDFVAAVTEEGGDQQMLEYTTSGDGPRLGLIVHHDDGEREVAYDRDSHTGTLDTAWDKAADEGWLVVSMKDDWNRIFSFET